MNKKRIFHIIIFGLFGISSLLTLWIVYAGYDSYISEKFVLSYVGFLLLLTLYMMSRLFKNFSKLNPHERRERIRRFALFFVGLVLLKYTFIDIRWESTIFIAFSMAFADVIWLKKQTSS